MFVITLLLFFVGIPNSSNAQNSLSLSVTPPLFQINVTPGETWRSGVKVVNNNDYPVTVWAEAVRFEPVGEDGHGRFQPVIDGELDESVMASWVSLVPGPYVIQPEQSFNVPFTLNVPETAAPGGHSAAILIGTRPPQREADGQVVVSTSQVVTSLFFARVAGDVVEKGSIREFSVTKLFHATPEATFTLRFENEGNVHLKPEGSISITNMWGKERGFIPINQKTAYGNVLPESIRKYEFTWTGESSITDIGRYKADVTVAYGQEARNFSDYTTYFWVIPVRATLITLGAVLLFVLFIIWSIRQYVRKAMLMAGIDPDEERVAQRAAKKNLKKSKEERNVPAEQEGNQPQKRDTIAVADQVKQKTKTVVRASMRAPIRAGVIDLRARIQDEEHYESKIAALWSFVTQYKTFALSVLVFVVIVIVSVWYVHDVRTEGRSYEVTLKSGNEEISYSSEEIIKDRLEGEMDETQEIQNDMPTTDESVSATTTVERQEYQLELINTSGTSGTAAEVAIDLEVLGYRIDHISSDTDRVQTRSVVVYDPLLEDVAVLLSNQLGDVPLSQFTGTSTDSVSEQPLIRVIVGTDQIRE